MTCLNLPQLNNLMIASYRSNANKAFILSIFANSGLGIDTNFVKNRDPCYLKLASELNCYTVYLKIDTFSFVVISLVVIVIFRINKLLSFVRLKMFVIS